MLLFLSLILSLSSSSLLSSSLSSNIQWHRIGKSIKCFHFIPHKSSMRHDYSLSSFLDEKTKAQKFQINFVPNSSVIELRYQPISAWEQSSQFSTYYGVAKSQISVKLNSSIAYVFSLKIIIWEIITCQRFFAI